MNSNIYINGVNVSQTKLNSKYRKRQKSMRQSHNLSSQSNILLVELLSIQFIYTISEILSKFKNTKHNFLYISNSVYLWETPETNENQLKVIIAEMSSLLAR